MAARHYALTTTTVARDFYDVPTENTGWRREETATTHDLLRVGLHAEVVRVGNAETAPKFRNESKRCFGCVGRLMGSTDSFDCVIQ